MKPVYARLHVLLAREAPLGVVIRHGTAKSVCTLLWDRKKDKFSLGQWMRGAIDTLTADLTPDGKHFLYSARKYVHATMDTHAWTVVSRTPYLKAVAYYPRRQGGGWFLNNRDYCVPNGFSDAGDRESLEVRRVELPGPLSIPLYVARMLRDDWTLEDRRSKFAGKLGFVRPAGSGWELRHTFRGEYQLSGGERQVDTSGWDWADIDGNRLVWTMNGCLWAGLVRQQGIDRITLLQDFNGMKFENLVAPYEGGNPVRPVSTPPPDLPRHRVSRKPAHRKPNRSRVRPDEDP